jgi:hypothetical protein
LRKGSGSRGRDGEAGRAETERSASDDDHAAGGVVATRGGDYLAIIVSDS